MNLFFIHPTPYRAMETKKPINISALLLLPVLLTACFSNDTPNEITEKFWLAAISQNEKVARVYTSKATLEKVDFSGGWWNGGAIELGEIRIKDEHARVETTIKMPNIPDQSPSSFRTFLVKENEMWKVDYEKTMASLDLDGSLSEILDEIGILGKQLSDDANKALSRIEKDLPKIEKKMETFGDTVKKDVEEAITKHGPQIKQELENFVRALEKALNDAAKPKKETEQPYDQPKVI